LKTFVSIYRDKDGSAFVGEPISVGSIEELLEAEKVVLYEIPSLVSIDVCEIHKTVTKEEE